MKRLIAALFGLLVTLSLVGPVGAQEEKKTTTVLRPYTVDAVTDVVSIMMVADDYSAITADDVSVTDDGAAVPVSSLKRSSDLGTPLEVMFVVDTRSSLTRGNALDMIKSTIADAIDDLPAGSKAGIVSAGGTAKLIQPLSDNLGQVRAAVERLEPTSDAVVIAATTRAAQQFEDRTTHGVERSVSDEAVRSVVVVSAGDDDSSTADVDALTGLVVTKGVQVFSVRYQGGTASIANAVRSGSGLNVGASTVAELETSLTSAIDAATDRLVLTVDNSASDSVRSNLTIVTDSASARLSFTNGLYTSVPSALQSVEVQGQAGPGFLNSSTGLYIAIPLAFLAIGLAIYAIGSLFFMGDSTLDSMLERYASEGDTGDMSAEESSIVQTALVQRAVEMSESFAQDRGFLTKVEDMLETANMPLRPGEAMSFLLAGAVTGGALGFVFFGGIFGALILSVLTGFLLLFYVRFKGKRRQKKFEQQLPDMLTLLAGTLRAGYSLPQGMEAVSHEIADPMGQEIRRVMTEAQLGRELEDALGTTADRMKSPDFAWAVMAIGIQREVGGNLNELLMTVAETMIARERLRGEVAALTAEGKMTAILLGGLPPGLGFMMWVMNAEYIEVLFASPLGYAMLAAGAMMMLVGMLWMKKVMTINV